MDPERLRRAMWLAGAMAVIDWIYLSRLFSGSSAAEDAEPISLSVFLFRIFLIAAVTGVPFAIMKWKDRYWTSKMAANLAMGTWGVVFMAFGTLHYSTCPIAAVLFFIPLTLGALLGHNVGKMAHPENLDDAED